MATLSAIVWLSVEGPTPPVMKIDGDVEGDEGEGVLSYIEVDATRS